MQPPVRQAMDPLEVHLQFEVAPPVLGCVAQRKPVVGEEGVARIRRSAPIGEEEEEAARQREELAADHMAGILIVCETVAHHRQDAKETGDHRQQAGTEIGKGTDHGSAIIHEVEVALAQGLGLVHHREGPNAINEPVCDDCPNVISLHPRNTAAITIFA